MIKTQATKTNYKLLISINISKEVKRDVTVRLSFVFHLLMPSTPNIDCLNFFWPI